MSFNLKMKRLAFLMLVVIFVSCRTSHKTAGRADEVDLYKIKPVKLKKTIASYEIKTGDVSVDELMEFAQSLIGVKYCYGSNDVKKGFDCSGFVWYVFNHFGIRTPRTSYEFTNVGKEVTLEKSKKGDLILFTGRDMNSGVVGHIGFIVENTAHQIKFIHSSTGNTNKNGVMVSTMSSYYRDRFVKVNSVFSK